MIDRGCVGCGDDEECAFHIGWLEDASIPGDTLLGREGLDFGECLRRNDVDVGFRLQQALDFLRRDLACADDDAAARSELKEDGEKAHSATPWGTRPAGRSR